MITNILLTDMKHYFLLFILLLVIITIEGCTEELHPETNGTNSPVLNEGELTKAVLDLSVNTFAVEAQAETRASIPSNIPENETSEEKEVHNIWVFQYDAVTKELLIKPRYYTITDQIMLQDLPVYLKAGIPSFVYVVTNTGYDNWANDDTDTSWQKFKNLEQLKKQTLPTAFPLRSIDKVSIPMVGASEEVEVTTGITVTVPVTRMYAKLKVKVEMLKAEMKLNNVNVRQIPNICRIETFAGDGNGEPMNAVPFPDGTTFSSIAFAASDLEKSEDKEWAVFYVPENLQGEIENQGGNKSDAAPTNALVVDVTAEIGGEKYLYAAYPGGSVYCATKAAVKALSDGLRIDLVDTPLRVTNIKPGMVETNFTVVRYRGDKEAADNFYKGIRPLTGDDIAETVYFAASAPEHIQIAEVLLMPTYQATGTISYKKKTE